MALSITEECVACQACEPVCPNDAIRFKSGIMRIDKNACTECAGYHELPQCVEICPVEGAITNADGTPMNPPGTLTGIPRKKKSV
ncbi:MAG: 4Fe-4S binding protein [Magnetococcales bacterium]|nr:4Fe-4S binding protein [Magnetococcales bacterium]